MLQHKIISFETPLEEAFFIKREKRFFVEFSFNQDVALGRAKGETFVAHTNNTGSMLGLLGKGRPILISKASNPKRKLGWTLEAVSTKSTSLDDTKESWIGVNTSIPNSFLQKIFLFQKKNPQLSLLPWAEAYDSIRMEVKKGESRLDACMEGENLPRLWVECKSVTLVEDDVAAFPDAVSERACKHLESLMQIVKEGDRGAMLYIIQRNDGKCFAPADYIDTKYAEKYLEAKENGVEIYTVIADVQKDGVYFGGVLLPRE